MIAKYKSNLDQVKYIIFSVYAAFLLPRHTLSLCCVYSKLFNISLICREYAVMGFTTTFSLLVAQKEFQHITITLELG